MRLVLVALTVAACNLTPGDPNAPQDPEAGFYVGAQQASWEKISDLADTATPRALAVSGKDVYAGFGTLRDVAIPAGSLWISRDEGATFAAAVLPENGLPAVVDIQDIAASGQVVVVATKSTGIWRSADAGATFTDANGNLPTTDATTVTLAPDRLYAGLASGRVWVSSDGGENWAEIPLGLPMDTLVHRIFLEPGRLLVGSAAGLVVTTDDFASFRTEARGLTATPDVKSIVRAGDALFAADGKGGVFVSRDDGARWDPTTSAVSAPVALVRRQDAVFAAGESVVEASFDGGSRWVAFQSGLPGKVFALARVEGHLIALVEGALWRTKLY